MDGRNEVVITVHGVESRGAWQDEIHPIFTGLDDFFHYPLNYSPFRFWMVGLPRFRKYAIERFYKKYSGIRQRHPGAVPSVVAHSLGTYIVSQTLLHYGIELNRIVLCGSIIHRDFDWRRLVRLGKVRGVRNEIAGDDRVVRFFRGKALRRLIPDSGPSGLDGFQWTLPQLEEPRFNFGHSGHFVTDEHCRTNWLPYLRGTSDFRDLCQQCLIGGPAGGAARQQFECHYVPLIEETVRRLLYARRPTEEQIRDYVLIVRRFVLQEGQLGALPPEQVINKQVLSLEQVLRRYE